jgi:outer membrane autotransporter protein
MAVVKEGDCAWIRIIGRVTTQRSVDGVPAFNVSNVTYQIGGQTAVATDLFVAGSLAFQSSTLNGKDGATGDGQSGYGGLALKWQPGAWLVAAAVTGSYGSFDTSRFIGLPGYSGTATASPSVYSIGARLRAGYEVSFQDWYVRPYVDLDLIHTHSPSYNESGPATVSLAFAAADQTAFVATPAAEVGARIDLAEGRTLRPFATAGVSYYSNSDWRVRSMFIGAPPGSGTFTTTIAEGHTIGRLGAGVQLLGVGSLDLRLQYDGEFGANRTSNGGFLTVAWRF